MILLDSNVPMYLVGAPHPNKIHAQRLLETIVRDRRRLVTDSGVLLEILHRCVAVARADAIRPTFDLVGQLVDKVLPVDRSIVRRAGHLLLSYPGLSAREASHVAVMQQHGIERVLSFDTGFDQIPDIVRIGAWRPVE